MKAEMRLTRAVVEEGCLQDGGEVVELLGPGTIEAMWPREVVTRGGDMTEVTGVRFVSGGVYYYREPFAQSCGRKAQAEGHTPAEEGREADQRMLVTLNRGLAGDNARLRRERDEAADALADEKAAHQGTRDECARLRRASSREKHEDARGPGTVVGQICPVGG